MQEKNSGIGEKERIVEIEVERLREFRGHPFKVKPDDQMAALFNAPTTIDGYYQAEVNHNMPEFVPGHRETELNVC